MKSTFTLAENRPRGFGLFDARSAMTTASVVVGSSTATLLATTASTVRRAWSMKKALANSAEMLDEFLKHLGSHENS